MDVEKPVAIIVARGELIVWCLRLRTGKAGQPPESRANAP